MKEMNNIYPEDKDKEKKEQIKAQKKANMAILAVFLLFGGAFIMDYSQTIGIACAIVGLILFIYLFPYLWKCMMKYHKDYE